VVKFFSIIKTSNLSVHN